MLQIRKKLQNVFKHFDTDLGDFILSKGYFKIDKGIFQIIEDGGARRMLYSLSEITVYDDTASGFPETFLTDVALYNRLFELGYNLIDYNGVNPSTPTVYATESPIDAPFTGSNTFELPLNYILISVFLDVDLRIKAKYIRTPTGIIILDTLVDGNIISIRGFIASGSVVGGSVMSVNDDDNGVVSVDNSNPTNPVVKFNGVFVDGTTINGSGTSLDPLVVIGGGGGADPSLITKFTSTVIPTVDDSTIVIPANNTWLIDSVPYTNTAINVLPFDYAYEGFSYFLTIVATKFNTFVAKVGSQSISNPDEPIIDEENELFLTTYLIYDNYIDVVVPPVSPNIYVEKESFAPLTLISSGYVASIELDKRNNIILSGTITKTGNVIKNNSNHFVVGLPFTTTNKTANPIEIQHLNTSGGSGSIAYFNPEELSYFLQPNEVAIWISEILNGQKIHRRVSSYIDRDNVIYRSGTEAGKPITGDLEINGDGDERFIFNGNNPATLYKNGIWFTDDGLTGFKSTDGINTTTLLNQNAQFALDSTNADFKGIVGSNFFDKEEDLNAFAQLGDLTPLENDIFELQMNKANQDTTYTKTEVDAKVASVYKIRGSVANFASLPSTGQLEGDVWNLLDNGDNYAWVLDLNNTGVAGWDKLSGSVDLTAYETKVVAESKYLQIVNASATVLATVLSGISFLTGGAIVSTDSVLVAFGKIQKQINDFGTALGLKQDALTDINFGTFTTSVADKNTQSDTDVLAYVDVTTGKWVKQTFSKLVDYLKGFFVDKTTDQSIDGIKTFTASPIVPTATSDSHAINFGQAKGLGKMHAILIDNNIGDIVQHTGTTTNTIVKAYTIPAGFFTSDCVFETDLTISKIGTAGNIIISFGIALPGTTLPIYSIVTLAGNQYINIGRKMTMIKNGLIIGFSNSGFFYSDKIANGALLNKLSTFDPTISNTFNLSITLGNASDIALLENLTIKVYKNA